MGDDVRGEPVASDLVGTPWVHPQRCRSALSERGADHNVAVDLDVDPPRIEVRGYHQALAVALDDTKLAASSVGEFVSGMQAQPNNLPGDVSGALLRCGQVGGPRRGTRLVSHARTSLLP
jgi:hypothetical protein